jgi:hypothetical protein
MTWLNERFGIGSVLRPMGLLLLILVFVFQLIAPSVDAAASKFDSQASHQVMSDTESDCPMHLAKMASTADIVQENGVSQEKCAHCVLSTCCFHMTFPSSEIVAAGMLLPDAKFLDRGSLIASSADSAQDRPPRHV